MPNDAAQESPPISANTLGRSNAIKCTVWALAIVAISYTLWARAFVPLQHTAVVLSLLAAAGIIWDLKRDSWRPAEKLQAFIPPFLFLLSVLAMLWLLFECWSGGLVTYFSAGPLLPYSDAAGYLTGAKSLLTLGELGQFAARRPMGTCLIAAVLEVGNQNYQTALILLALLAGVATFFATREVWLTGGLATALLYLVFCNLVMRQWLIVFMAETPGYIFGSLSFAFLLAGFRQSSFRWSLLGFGLLIIALSARPGAMLVLPFLGIYLIYFFSESWRSALRKGLVLSLLSILLLTWSPLLVRKISPKGAYQGELSYTLYGLAAGGGGWDYVFTEHPEIAQIASEGERSQQVYTLFRHQFAAKPGLFFLALYYALITALEHPASVFFGLVLFIPPEIPAGLALVALTLLLPFCFRRTGAWTFLFWVAVGILLSAPFLFDAGWRVYMATIPFELGLAASAVPLALSWIRKIRRHAPSKENEPDSALWQWGALGFTIILASAVTIFPLLISMKSHAAVKSLISREANDRPEDEIFYYNPGSGILVGAESRIPGVFSTPLVSVTQSADFAKELKTSRHVNAGNFLSHALFLRRPEDNAYVLFDQVPDARAGYLKVSLRLLEQRQATFFYKAEAFRRVDF